MGSVVPEMLNCRRAEPVSDVRLHRACTEAVAFVTAVPSLSTVIPHFYFDNEFFIIPLNVTELKHPGRNP